MAAYPQAQLARTPYGQGLLNLFKRLTPYIVLDWGNDDSTMKEHNRPGDRLEAASLDDANVITSLLRPDPNDPWSDQQQGRLRHMLVLDIDHPAWLVKSTTENHYHLYVDVPGGISVEDYNAVLDALANAGVIEPGYAGASKARGFTAVRLPWIKKEKGPKQHD